MTNISNQLNIKNLLQTKWIDQFNYEQLEQIKIGLEKDLDISYYANPIYKWSQMKQIRYGLEANIDVTIYADPKYNWLQMEKIRWGIRRWIRCNYLC